MEQNRKILYHYLKQLNLEQLTTIPEGFNNNIWWNIPHVIATHQLLVYRRSGLEVNVPEQLISNYKKGTFPNGSPENDEIETVKELLFSTVEKNKKDYENGRFKSYDAYLTTPKVQLSSAEDALAFNVFHEGLHLGAIIALQKAIGAN